MPKFDADVAGEGAKFREVDYVQETFLGIAEKMRVIERLNQKLAEGWTLVYTDHEFGKSANDPIRVFHVFAR